jgi:hypothetical protein
MDPLHRASLLADGAPLKDGLPDPALPEWPDETPTGDSGVRAIRSAKDYQAAMAERRRLRSLGLL